MLGFDSLTYFAAWRPAGVLDRSAGHRRNSEMLDNERPDALLAYPGPASRGTWHCMLEGARRQIPVAAMLLDKKQPPRRQVLQGLKSYLRRDEIERVRVCEREGSQGWRVGVWLDDDQAVQAEVDFLVAHLPHVL